MDKHLKRQKTIDLYTANKITSSKKKSDYFNPYAKKTPYSNIENYRTPVTSEKMKAEQIQPVKKLSKKQRLQKKRQQKTRFMIKLVSVMSITTMLVWGAMMVKDKLTYPKVSYQIVQQGSIDSSHKFSGLIIRDEKVYYSQAEGTIQTVISEGEKVKKDGIVCFLLNNTSLSSSLEQKQQMNTTLYNVANKRESFSYFQDDLYAIDSSIQNTMDNFYTQRFKDTTEYVYNLRNDLEKYVNQRTNLYIDEQNELGEPLGQKLMSLDSQINEAKLVNKSQNSGIVSYYIDGMEEDTTLDTIDYESFQKIISSSYSNRGNNTYITKETPLYKVITEDTWNIITYTDLKQAESYQEGVVYTLTFDNIRQLDILFKLQQKTIEEDQVKLVFSTNDQINQFLDVRTIDFNIGNKNQQGLKIPLQAITEQNMLQIPSEYKIEKDGKIGVYRKNAEVIEFVPINPQYEKNEIIYIFQEIGTKQKIALNDLLYQPTIEKTFKVTDLTTVEGVYVINGQLAQFKAIGKYSKNNEYAIISYDANNELKELDKIISNPKSIKRDQLLKHMNIQNE